MVAFFVFCYLSILSIQTNQMSYKSFFYLCCFFFLLLSCQKQTQQQSLDKFMVGKWETTYLKIEFETFNKSDSSFVYEDKFDNNPERIAQSNYMNNGMFQAWFLDTLRQQQGLTKGVWQTKGDSLLTSYYYINRNVRPEYKIKQTENGFEGFSKYDWDNDGEFDDVLWMITKRIQ